MPKKTSTMGDFSGGLNFNADISDIQGMKSVHNLWNLHVDHVGKLSAFDPTHESLQWDDHESNVSGNITGDYIDLDRGIGHATPTNVESLKLVVGPVSPADTDLSWEDGFYDFKYTVCRELGNGIIEEGPLQLFLEDSGGDNINVDMTEDDMGKFTFTHSGDGGDATPGHPDHMNTADYEGKLCGRVYYSRRQGQGSTTQVGYIHLCDLILTDFDAADKVLPRAINTTGTPTATAIDIEEPPTASSFEMNAAYPSDIGILDVTASPFTDCESRVILGMTTYIAKSGYIYRSVPGQPDIFPTDNWVDLTKYGTSTPCKAMYGLGNVLCYFTVNELIVFDIVNDVILKTMRGYGIDESGHASKVNEGVAFRVPGDTNLNTRDFFYFDGNKMRNLTKGRGSYDQILGGTNIMYQEGVDWLSWIISRSSFPYYDIRGVYSFKSDTIFETNVTSDDGGTTLIVGSSYVDFGQWHGGDPARYKRIYKIILHGSRLDTSTLYLVDEAEDEIAVTRSYDIHNVVTWTPDSSLKARVIGIYLHPLSTHSEGALHSFSVVYRDLNKF